MPVNSSLRTSIDILAPKSTGTMDGFPRSMAPPLLIVVCDNTEKYSGSKHPSTAAA